MKSTVVSRVSTEEQKEAGNSPPAQTHRIEQYFKRKDYAVGEATPTTSWSGLRLFKL